MKILIKDLGKGSYGGANPSIAETNLVLLNDGESSGLNNITEIPNRSYNDLQDLPALNFLSTTSGGSVTGTITATTFVKSGATSDDVLLGDGTTTSLSGIGGGGGDGYVTGATFSGGTLTIQQTGGSSTNQTVSLDGRYLQSYTETDTLQNVTTRGATTTDTITAASFVRTSATADDILLGNGTTTSLAALGNVDGLNGVIAVWAGTQAQYDAIGTPDANTLYFIT